MSSATKTPATLTTTERGVTRRVWDVKPGHYIWHRGAFRLVTAVEGTRVIRMGRYALHMVGTTVEAAPGA